MIFFRKNQIILLFLVLFYKYGNCQYTWFNKNLNEDSITWQQFFNQQDDTLLMTVNLKKAASSYSRLMNGLAELSTKHNAFKSHTVVKNDNVWTLISENYKIDPSDYKETYKSLANHVAAINSLDSKRTIQKGDSILLPNLPYKPAEDKSSAALAQYFDFYDNSSKVVYSADLYASAKTSSFANVSLEKASTFATRLSANDINDFICSFSVSTFENTLKKYIYVARPPRLVDMYFPDQSDDSENVQLSPFYLSPRLKTKLDSIDKTKFGSIVILDSFNNDECTHGKKVLQVIETRLTQYGFSSLIGTDKIITYPINYFQNIDKANQFLETFYNNREGDEKDDGLRYVRILRKLKNKTGKPQKGSPDIYLRALFHGWYNRRPDVISTSFYVSVNDVNFLPRLAINEVSLVTAALNDDGSKIEDKMYISPVSTFKPVASIEPIYSYFLSYSTGGSIISGCYVGKGTYSGMTSKDGSKISIVGNGIGWGTNTTCLKPNEKGTSFATPDISTSLYVAKAYWRTKNLNVDCIQARKRLLLSIDIDSVLVGHFAGAGPVNMLKLLQYAKGYIEERDGEIIPITRIELSRIEFENGDASHFGDSLTNISGISLFDGQSFCFNNSSLSWCKCHIKNLSIQVTDEKNGKHTIGLADFTSKYKQLVTF